MIVATEAENHKAPTGLVSSQATGRGTRPGGWTHRSGLRSDLVEQHRNGPRPGEDPTNRSPYSSHGTPTPLVAAAGLCLVEGILVTLYGVVLLADIHADRVVMGATTAGFLVAYGVGLIVCARGLNRVRPWARGPVLMAQLIWLGIAWFLRTGNTWLAAVGLAILAIVVLAGVLHPRSIAALEAARR